jgi:hypothetical protein
MGIMDAAAWSLIWGLSFMSIGGLLIWAYGNSLSLKKAKAGSETVQLHDLKKRFAGILIYSLLLIIIGLGSLVQGTLFLLH